MKMFLDERDIQGDNILEATKNPKIQNATF